MGFPEHAMPSRCPAGCILGHDSPTRPVGLEETYQGREDGWRSLICVRALEWDRFLPENHEEGEPTLSACQGNQGHNHIGFRSSRPGVGEALLGEIGDSGVREGRIVGSVLHSSRTRSFMRGSW